MKTTTAERDPEAAAKLRSLIEDIVVAMVITVTPEGSLRSRPMITQAAPDEGELWFLTSDESEMADDLAEEKAVNVSYADIHTDRYVSVTGQATLSRERARLEELWKPSLTRFFPAGLDDPHLALLRVRIETAEYWDAKASRMVSLRAAHENATDGDRPAAGTSRNGDAEHTRVEIRATPASG